MRVRFRVAVSDGAGRRFVSGQTAEVPDDVARSWLGLGFCEPADTGRREAVTRAPRTARKGTKGKRRG